MKNPRFPLGVKILGLAVSLLGLLVAIAFTSHLRISRVKAEVEDLVDHIVRTQRSVERVNTHSLKQALHFERIVEQYEGDVIDADRIQLERNRFEAETSEVESELLGALGRARSFEANVSTLIDHDARDSLTPMLERIQQDHENFHEAAMDTFRRLEDGRRGTTIRELEDLVNRDADTLRQTMDELVLELSDHTDRAARSSERHQRAVGRNLILITLSAVALGLVYAGVFTRKIVSPIGQLVQQIRTADTDGPVTSVQVGTHDEVALLADTFTRMFQNLSEKERLKATFGQYVDPRVVDRLEDGGRNLPTLGEKRVVTVLMSDLDDFARTTERLGPDETMSAVNRYLGLLAPSVLDRHGFIEFVGTAIKGFWTSPFVDESEHAHLACEAALEQAARFDDVPDMLDTPPHANAGGIRHGFHIGVATGPLVLGNVGPRGAMAYTVLGDTVNTASRVRGVAREYGVRIVMIDETARLVDRRFATRELGQVRVVGKDDTLRVFELMGHAGELDARLARLRETYAVASEAYRRRDWDQAAQQFEACLRIEPDDGPSKLHLAWISNVRGRELPDDWDGVWQLTSK